MEIQLAPHARLWVFTSNKLLTSEQCEFIESELKQFLEGWNNHGRAMAGQAWIEMNRILVVAADENIMLASGCSIDKLNREVLRIGDALRVNLFDRLTVLFKENEEIQTEGIAQFWALRKANRLTDETLVLDTTVATVGDWNTSKWKPFANTWHKDMYGR
jgi:hypothetical protein